MATKRHKSYRWQQFRASLLRREPLCRYCARPAQEIDHIMPVSRGGAFWDRKNLQPLCRACHEKKTAAENRAPLPKHCIHGWPDNIEPPCPDCATGNTPPGG